MAQPAGQVHRVGEGQTVDALVTLGYQRLAAQDVTREGVQYAYVLRVETVGLDLYGLAVGLLEALRLGLGVFSQIAGQLYKGHLVVLAYQLALGAGSF